MFVERMASPNSLNLLFRAGITFPSSWNEQKTSIERQTRIGVFPSLRSFVAEQWPKLFGISALVLIPCFWHSHIEAGDLGSHVYNAWLAQLIEHGHASGLWISHPSTNVLFDYLLSGFAKIFGLQIAEKVSVAIAVLIFFWGTFALVSTAAQRAPWFLTPGLTMVAYGWTFEMGFLNYYVSLGLSFFALAIVWRGKGWEPASALALVPFIYLAHPLGVLWLIYAAAYIRIADFLSLRFQVLLILAAAAGLYLLRLYLWRHFITSAPYDPIYLFNGGDQLVLFGNRYKIVEVLLGMFFVVAIAVGAVTGRNVRDFWHGFAMPLQLYVLVEIGVLLLPDGVRPANQPAALALLTERLTLVSAVLICCLLGAMRPRKWHLIVTAGIAVVFFVFLYQDTSLINRMEAQVEHLVKTLPADQRVLATIRKPDESRVLVQHIVDRACIGHCFSYGNYEPSSAVFQIRASFGNPYVISDFDEVASMEAGDYTVQAEDLPAYQIYQCSGDWTELCIRPLEEGELNDRLGVHPEN
jgi:hypothetical protein